MRLNRLKRQAFLRGTMWMKDIVYYFRNVLAGFFIIVVPIWLMCHGITRKLVRDNHLAKVDLYMKQEYFADRAVGCICILISCAIFTAAFTKSVFFELTLLQISTIGILLLGFGFRCLFPDKSRYYF